MTLIFTNRRDQIMKTAKFESKKILKAAKTRRVAGVKVRSGVKAGIAGAGRGPAGAGGLHGGSRFG